jgi:signal recognition particle GTPase
VHELGEELNEAGLAEAVAENWLAVARAWKLGYLAELAQGVLDKVTEELMKADARMELAMEIADAPRKEGEKPNLSYEQEQEVRRLIKRSDAFNNAYTDLQDLPEGQIDEKRLRNTLAVLAEESDRAAEEASRRKEELGLATSR